MNVLDFIICDDVRPEQLNKFSLMGLYNDRIAITVADKATAKWPFVMSLGLYVRLGSSEKLPPAFDFNVEFFMNEKKLGSIAVPVMTSSELMAAIPIRIPQFPLTEEGNLKFSLRAKKKTGEEIYVFEREIKVVLVQQPKETTQAGLPV
jgi:hypothetical protein